MNRRKFLALTGAAASAVVMPGRSAKAASGFFTLGQRDGRWWLFTPEGKRFFSTGLNHVDFSPLCYPGAGGLWESKYGNSMERWLKEAVRPDLDAWGFNTLGWNQEVVIRDPTIHRHSPSFTYEEYQWLGMPYCHLLPFSEIHQWEAETRLPDFYSSDFEGWCDYVARSQCSRFRDDPKLIGYFYSDCPLWVHTTEINKWKGPLFDPGLLDTEAGRAELTRLAARYYEVTRHAIRRYDPNHLIFGDRYEANAPLPMQVVEAARPYVDALAFQDFKDPVGHLREWYAQTKMPVLWADGAKNVGATDPESGERIVLNGGAWYGEALAGLRENPGCIGAHLCGAYLRNHARRRGLRDARERPDTENIALITQANQAAEAWVASFE